MTSSRITCSGQNLQFSRTIIHFVTLSPVKLGAAQIRWLSELALYDFDIVYRTRKSNLVADALSRHPEVEEEIEREVLPKSDDEEWIAVSYQVEEQGGRISSMEFNQVISELVGGTKIDKKLKDRIQVTDVAKKS